MNLGRTREDVPVGHPGGEEAATLGLPPNSSSSTILRNPQPEAPGSRLQARGSAPGQRPPSYRRRHRIPAISLAETSLRTPLRGKEGEPWSRVTREAVSVATAAWLRRRNQAGRPPASSRTRDPPGQRPLRPQGPETGSRSLPAPARPHLRGREARRRRRAGSLLRDRECARLQLCSRRGFSSGHVRLLWHQREGTVRAGPQAASASQWEVLINHEPCILDLVLSLASVSSSVK